MADRELNVAYERRGDFDNSRLKESLVFRVDSKRIGVFKSHNPSSIGVAVDLPNGSVGCFEMPCDEFHALFEREWDRRRAAAEIGKAMPSAPDGGKG